MTSKTKRIVDAIWKELRSISSPDLRLELTSITEEKVLKRLELVIAPLVDETKLNLLEVESSTIKALGYLSSAKVLEVEFVSGGRYRYFDVPQEVYNQFLLTESKGRYLASHIKNNFEYEKIS